MRRLLPLISAPVLALTAMACERTPTPVTPEAPAVATEPASAPAAPASPEAAPTPSALPAGHPPLGDAARRPPPGPVDPNTPLPPGHPPVPGATPPAGMPSAPAGRPVAAPVPSESGVELPLPLEGSGGLSELTARKAMLPEAHRAPFEEAFRLIFTIERQKRDAARAGTLVEPLIADADAKVQAAGHRLAGYLAINRNFDTAAALTSYRAAIAADPDYGEAHYALAFTLAISDLAAGRTHFDRAMALGVPDTRNLRGQFYGDAGQ